MKAASITNVEAKPLGMSALYDVERTGQDVLWKIFAVLLMTALGSEFFDKEQYPLTPQFLIPFPRFMLVASLLFAMFMISILKRRVRLDVPHAYLPLLLFWYANQLSLVGLLWKGGGIGQVLQFILTDIHLTVYVLFVYMLLKLSDWPRLRFLLRTYYYLGLVAAIVAIFQYVHVDFGWFPWMSTYLFDSGFYRQMGFRASSVFGEPSWAARYYIHWIALSLAFYSHSRKKRYIWFLLLFSLVFYMAASLAGYTVLLVFGAIFCWMQIRRRVVSVPRWTKTVLFLAGIILVCTSLLLIIFRGDIFLPSLIKSSIERFLAVLQGSQGVEVRLDSIVAGLKVWASSPLFGVGLGNLRFYVAQFYTDPQTFLRSYLGADSAYSQVLAELGLLGLLAFALFLLRVVARMGETPRQRRKPREGFRAIESRLRIRRESGAP